MAGARQIVDGPSFATLPYGLWDAVEKREGADSHWQNGVTYLDRCPAGGTVMEECIAVTGEGSVAAQAALVATFTQQARGATAFTVYAEFDCSPVGRSGEDRDTAAVEALAKTENWQAERSFWTGTAGKSGSAGQTTVWPHLAADTTLDDAQSIRLQTAASPLVTGGEDPAVVMGLLEQNLADCYHGLGYLHMSPAAYPSFRARGLVEESGDGLYSPGGHRVVVGSGYTGSSPAGAAPAAGTSWVYATGRVFGYRSGVHSFEMPETFDRSENTVKALAYRTFLFGFECCHYAALVNLGVPTT